MKKPSKLFGPSTLVAAAFIGPGTLTTCTIAGVTNGYSLLWAMVFSIITTIVLQEMSARLGFVSRKGLGEAINNQFNKGIARYIVFFLVIGAIIIGNAAYEAGNLSGGVLGIELLFGHYSFWPIFIALISFFLLYQGNYKWIEKILVVLVLLMSICFLITAILVKPDLSVLFSGFIPNGLEDNLLLIMGIIGTTVVPYNLFLHASTISKKWDKDANLKAVRTENNIAIILGGFISILIIITAASVQGSITTVSSAKDLAIQLEPTFGVASKYLMGIGLMAAGISSALTAPLAAAYAAKGLFGWDNNEKSFKFRAVWMTILSIGLLVSITGFKPISIIQFAQLTNAILLPFIAIFLLYISNTKKILGAFTNSLSQNILSGIIILITLGLSIFSLNKLFEFL